LSVTWRGAQRRTIGGLLVKPAQASTGRDDLYRQPQVQVARNQSPPTVRVFAIDRRKQAWR
jgi:hypothetical protein